MNKSNLFKTAHETARNLLWIGSCKTYRVAFAEALRRAYQAAKRAAKQAAEAAMPVRAIYLSVPYSEKDKAKKAGAKWDATAKSWYVVASAVPAALKRWEGSANYSARILSTTCYA